MTPSEAFQALWILLFLFLPSSSSSLENDRKTGCWGNILQLNLPPCGCRRVLQRSLHSGREQQEAGCVCWDLHGFATCSPWVLLTSHWTGVTKDVQPGQRTSPQALGTAWDLADHQMSFPSMHLLPWCIIKWPFFPLWKIEVLESTTEPYHPPPSKHYVKWKLVFQLILVLSLELMMVIPKKPEGSVRPEVIFPLGPREETLQPPSSKKGKDKAVQLWQKQETLTAAFLADPGKTVLRALSSQGTGRPHKSLLMLFPVLRQKQL